MWRHLKEIDQKFDYLAHNETLLARYTTFFPIILFINVIAEKQNREKDQKLDIKLYLLDEKEGRKNIAEVGG